MDNKIKSMFRESIALMEKTNLTRQIKETVSLMCDTFKKGNTIFTCGNGGSMEQAMHIAGELVDRFRMDRKALPVVTLGANHAVLTAWANDYDYTTTFCRELEALGKKGDLLIVLSTSGNSKNIIETVRAAKIKRMKTVGFLGESGALQALVDIRLAVPSHDTPRIQEVHMVLIHVICELVEKEIAGRL